MHAYLVVGNDTNDKINEIVDGIKGKRYDFPLSKIEEVRLLNDFLKNTLPERTVIVCQGIDGSTVEALNAFLKNLEEPQTNVSFILSARNEHKVIPTILSRCQLIHLKNIYEAPGDDLAGHFLSSSKGEQLLTIDKLKSREDAVKFVKDLIEALKLSLNKNGKNVMDTAKDLEICQHTLNNLEANGNVNLQLSSMTVNLISGQK